MAKVDYSYVYVAETELSDVGCWIHLEPDKSLSLVSLRNYFPTCFGIKYTIVDANQATKVQYIKYHCGYFRFPFGLDLNNTRFVAYYYNDLNDIKAFMEMIESDDNESMITTTMSASLLPEEGSANENYSLLARSMDFFNMDKILQRGAQSTPLKCITTLMGTPIQDNVSSTSDVILNEPTIEVITIQDSQCTIPVSLLPPPPPHPPPGPSGIKSKLGPSVSSTSDEKRNKSEWENYERNTNAESSIDCSSARMPKSKNTLNRYQQNRKVRQNLYTRTPVKVTIEKRSRTVQHTREILKIEDKKGRTTALLTKRKWPETGETTRLKRRTESGDEFAGYIAKRRRFVNQYEKVRQPEPYQYSAFASPNFELNVLLVGFQTQRPIDQETIKYFSDFGIVTHFQVSSQHNRHSGKEYYATMRIRTNDALSIFSDRHLYNGAIVYAIRVDGDRPPSKVTCKLCGYYGLNVGFLHYHVEGQCHQRHLTKQLRWRAGEMGQTVYLDSYYRISSNELYVQFAANEVQEMVQNDYWMRCYQPVNEARANGSNYFNRAVDMGRYC